MRIVAKLQIIVCQTVIMVIVLYKQIFDNPVKMKLEECLTKVCFFKLE